VWVYFPVHFDRNEEKEAERIAEKVHGLASQEHAPLEWTVGDQTHFICPEVLLVEESSFKGVEYF